MRIALVTANIGNFDAKPMTSLPRTEVHCFIEPPVPLPNLNNRLRGKYIKMMTHRFLPGYDAYVWVDGSVEVLTYDFMKYMRDALFSDDVAISLHHERKNAYQELDYIKFEMDNGSEYLRKRYVNEPLNEEYEFYTNQGLPTEYPLYACRFFARRNNKKVNAAFEEWFLKTVEYSNFDQTMFSWVCWNFDLKVKELDYMKTVEKYLKITKH